MQENNIENRKEENEDLSFDLIIELGTLTTSQMAKLLNVSELTVRKLVEELNAPLVPGLKHTRMSIKNFKNTFNI